MKRRQEEATQREVQYEDISYLLNELQSRASFYYTKCRKALDQIGSEKRKHHKKTFGGRHVVARPGLLPRSLQASNETKDPPSASTITKWSLVGRPGGREKGL